MRSHPCTGDKDEARGDLEGRALGVSVRGTDVEAKQNVWSEGVAAEGKETVRLESTCGGLSACFGWLDSIPSGGS